MISAFTFSTTLESKRHCHCGTLNNRELSGPKDVIVKNVIRDVLDVCIPRTSTENRYTDGADEIIYDVLRANCCKHSHLQLTADYDGRPVRDTTT